MKNRYEILKEIGNFKNLIALGIIPINIFDWIVIYESYLEDRKNNKKMVSYQYISEKYKLSEVHIRNVVKWMETN